MLTHRRGAASPPHAPLSRAEAEQVLELLAALRSAGVEVEAAGDRLRLSAPPGVLDEALRARVVAQRPALLAFLAAPGARDSRRRGRPAAGPRGSQSPLSHAQQRLWLLQQMHPDSSVYNVPYAFRIEGALDAGALSAALDELVERHEALRTIMAQDAAGPFQRVREHAGGLLTRVDLSSEPQRLSSLLETESRLPFDLERGPLLRAALIGLGPDEHVLFFNAHHVICDGWSIEILLDELGRLYEARVRGVPAQLAPLPIQYADFARWEHETVTPADQAAALAFHRGQLAGALEPLELPADHPRPKLFHYRGAVHRFELEGELVAALGELGQRHHATTFMVMLAAFQVLLARVSRQRNIVVGSPMAGRLHPDTEPLIGFFANTVVLRGSVGDDPSFIEFLGRVRAACLAAYEHQSLPFQWLVDAVEPPRDPSRTPLFQALFTFQDTRRRQLDRCGLRWSRIDIDSGGAKTDVTLLLEEHEQGLSGWLEFSTELFERPTIERLAHQYRTLLESIVARPEMAVARLELERPDVAAPRPPAAGRPAVRTAGNGSSRRSTHVVPLSATGEGEPLFCFGGLDLYQDLARHVAVDRPVYGVVLAAEEADVTETAHDCVTALRSQQPHGPYHLAGIAFGGVLAYETAQQLLEAGEMVALLVIIDVVLPELLRRAPLRWLRDRFGRLLRNERAPHAAPRHDDEEQAELSELDLPQHRAAWKHYRRRLRPYSGRVLVFRAREPQLAGRAATVPADCGWSAYVPSEALSHHEVPGDHLAILREPQVEELARVLRAHLDAPASGRGEAHARKR